MADFKLLNYAGAKGEPRPGILTGSDTVVDLQGALPGKSWTGSTLGVLGAWDEALPALHALAGERRRVAPPRRRRLMAPLLYPPAIYCAGANYNAHAKEMSQDGKVAWTRPRPSLISSSSPDPTALSDPAPRSGCPRSRSRWTGKENAPA